LDDPNLGIDDEILENPEKNDKKELANE